jgi:hypothetical protein
MEVKAFGRTIETGYRHQFGHPSGSVYPSDVDDEVDRQRDRLSNAPVR